MKKRVSDTVLIVNDDTDQLELLQELLERAGYEVLKAENGVRGLELAARTSPDLVVSDVMMPVMNGIELCRRLRQLPATQRVPVMLVSALRVDSESAVEGFRAGADDYLEVPFEKTRFIAKVERLFERKRDEEAQIQLAKAQSALRESRTELAYIKFALDESTIVAIADADGRLSYFNEKLTEISGFSRADLKDKSYAMFADDPDAVSVFNSLWQTVRVGNVWKGQIRSHKKGGDAFWVETTIVPVLGDNQRPHKYISISHDITEAKEAEASLKLSEKHHRALIENASDLVSIVDADGVMRYQSPSVTRLLGYEPSELNGKCIDEFVSPDDLEIADQTFEALLTRPNETASVEISFRHKQGHFLTFECVLTNLLGDSAINGIVSNAFDVTARKMSEAALRESEERYRILFDHNPLPMWVVDATTGKFLAVNDEAINHYGYSRNEFYRLTESDLQAPAAVAGALKEDDPPVGKTPLLKHIKKDCSLIDVEVTSHELNFGGSSARLVLVKDVTERRWAERALRLSEEQLRQSQKLESVGRLAGGIAHDFNNMLTAINGYSDLLLAQIPADNPLRRNVEEIRKAGIRSAELTRQLLAFSRRQIMQPKVFDLNTIIGDTIVMLQRLIGEDIRLIPSLNEDIGPIEADPGQISQVIMNLVVNSRDAMPNGGTIIIETENARLDEQYVGPHLTVREGDYVMLAVSDTGFGMDEETQKQIFEPFFTTKEMGKGTGLGLSTVYGIVKQSGGNIWVYSEPGKGTTVKIYLPRLPRENEQLEARRIDEKPLRGTETILLVEDEEVVRKLSREVLELCGYKVIEAEHGIAALAICERYEGKIDLLMTDVVMPQMGGRELAQILTQAYPGMKVLFSSGYTDDAIIRHGILSTGSNFIQKPFTFERLTKKVRELFDGT